MAAAFLCLDTEAARLKALDNHLSGKPFICGEKMTTDDVEVFGAISGEPSSESYTNTIMWYKYVKNALLWSYRMKAGWVSIDGQEASVEQSKESIAEEDVGEETEEEKEAAEEEGEAAKASERMWSLEVVDAGEEVINRLEKNVPKLSTIVTDVKSAKLVYLSEHEGRKTVKIVAITTPFEDIDEEYSPYLDDFIHAVLFSTSASEYAM